MSLTLNDLQIRGKTAADWINDLAEPESLPGRNAIESLADGASQLSGLMQRLSATIPKTSDPAVRVAVIAALCRIGLQVHSSLAAAHAGIKSIIITDSNEEVRTAGVQAITMLGPRARSEAPVLISALKDDVAEVRAGAARALGDLGPDAREATPTLISLVSYEKNPRTRVEAAAALWRINHVSTRVLPALIESLGHADEYVRWVAADCLVEIGPEARSAVPALLTAFAMPCKAGMVRLSIRLALERIDPAAAAELL